MVERAHARLSASGSETWMSCPGSVLAAEDLPPESSSRYADEGTAAHGLGELKARAHFGQITRDEYDMMYSIWLSEEIRFTADEATLADFERYTDEYVNLIEAELASMCPGAQVLFEQRLDSGIPNCWGTSDTVLFCCCTVKIIDLKYGQGVRVNAEDNSQLRIYALGALDEYGDILGTTKSIEYIVHQPRLEHVSREETHPDELREWREKVVKPVAEIALKPGAPFNPTEENCRWCAVSGRCRAQAESVFSAPFEEPATLSPEEISEALERVAEIRTWLSALEAAALKMAYEEQVPIPGRKVVMSGGIRKIIDPDGAREALHLAGWSDDKIGSWKINGIGDLEKRLGKHDFELVVAPFVERTSGRPSLVPESDSRPDINRNSEAARVFSQPEE